MVRLPKYGAFEKRKPAVLGAPDRTTLLLEARVPGAVFKALGENQGLKKETGTNWVTNNVRVPEVGIGILGDRKSKRLMKNTPFGGMDYLSSPRLWCPSYLKLRSSTQTHYWH